MLPLLQCLTNHVNLDSPLKHTEITTMPPPKTPYYCTRSSSSPPPPQFMHVTGVPGELYRTEPDNQWGYYSSANRNSIKCFLVIIIVGVGVVINM
ncbi:unnamed protein product [Cochlearia groenlandica]